MKQIIDKMDFEMTYPEVKRKNTSVKHGRIVKSYSISVERGSKRRYVMRSGKKWYLDEHLGKYRYADQYQSCIYIL